MQYEAVIGLEVHAQLATKSKLFCGDSTAFGADPNTQVSPVTLAHPGTLPKVNATAIEYAIKMGLACHCGITRETYFARKNYFYPDLPKGYQISQHTTPVCKGGYVSIKTAGGSRNVQLNRIHLEEDAGKSIHDIDDNFSCIDLNRAGTPLIEIVTEPDLFSAEEAWQYVTEIRKLVRWLGICDGNMEEGSLRCDANVSIRPKGEKKLGTKVEIKNLNSIRNVRKAIEFEIERMERLAGEGNPIIQQTRSFDASTDTTFAMRDKEEANDYRYFPDPDLAPIRLTQQYISRIEASLPPLPAELTRQLQQQFGLNEYDAVQLCEDKSSYDYFSDVVQHTHHYKAVANWLLGPLRQYNNEHDTSFESIPLQPQALAALIALVENGSVSFSVASAKLLPALMEKNIDPLKAAEEMNLLQTNDTAALETWINEALESMPEKLAEYKKGKKGLIGLFAGEVKKRSRGKADPRLVMQLLEQKLNN